MGMITKDLEQTLRSKIRWLTQEIERLEKQRTAMETVLSIDDLPVESSVPTKASRSRKHVFVKPPVKKGPPPALIERKHDPSKPNTGDNYRSKHNLAIDLVLEVISRRNGPVEADILWEELEEKLECSKATFFKYLSDEVMRLEDARLRRTTHGVYDVKAVARKIELDRSEEEVQKILQEARNKRGG